MLKMTTKKRKPNDFDNQLTFIDLYSERVCLIPIRELYEPDIHPFQVKNDEQMKYLVESVKRFGIQEPGLVRPRIDGGYELLCGNRRKRACEIIGLTVMPVIVREIDDDIAITIMIDSNLQQREHILPSEKAFAYKMKMDALNHNGVKADKHSCEIMAEQTGESAAQIFRFIRLTELTETLLDKIDTHKIAFTPAVEISYLSYDEQLIVVDCMEKYDIKPSLSQAVRLKKMKQSGILTSNKIETMLAEDKKPNKNKPKGTLRFRKFFPPEYSSTQIEKIIMQLLKEWKTKMND